MSTLKGNWFTEVYNEGGIALGLEIEEQLLSIQTNYQKLDVYRTKRFGNLLTLDGLVMLTQRDNFIYHEMIAHPVLYTHPAPKNIVIIGGGDCGTLQQVLKHSSVRDVVQCDIDEAVTQAATQYFPELCTSNSDPRASIIFKDGIHYISSLDSKSIDVIIIDSSDPVGPGEGLFTAELYTHCRRVLRENGLLVQQSESPLLHVDLLCSIRYQMMKAPFPFLQTLNFPQCTYPSGWWTVTIAGNDIPEFRIEKESIETRYYNSSIHQASQALPEFLKHEFMGRGIA